MKKLRTIYRYLRLKRYRRSQRLFVNHAQRLERHLRRSIRIPYQRRDIFKTATTKRLD
jgi:hypothetical protein